jgi:hypothetical protein
MGWKFWEKNRSDENQRVERSPKLPRVKELPNEVGRHLVVAKGYEPDWVWALRCAVRPIENSKNRLEIRVFSPEAASQRGVAVKNYTSLDDCPDLILFAGWYDKATRRVQLENLLDKAV